MPNTTIFGALGLPDTDVLYLATMGQTIVYDATAAVLGDHNADLEMAKKLFVGETTSDHKRKFKLAGNGRLQRVNRAGTTMSVKAGGSWDVAFPLEEFGARIEADRTTFGYMTLQQWQLHLETVMRQDRNTMRFEILKALFNNTERSFNDENWGTLLVEPLANGDSVKYPPVIGAEVNATANMYLGVAADSRTITDANNPLPTLVNQLEQYFGTPTGGSNIVVFCNNAQTKGIQGLAGFDPVPNRFVEYGEDVSLVGFDKFPAGLPGRVLGETDSALIVEWRWVPAGYLLAVHLDAPPPLIERVDPAHTGLGTGLQMVAEDMDHPFRQYDWSHRYGFGAGNRLNGAVMDLSAAGGASTYTIPTQYA